MSALLNVRVVDDIAVVRLAFNEINLEQREELKKELIALVSESQNKFVVNLSHVGFLSSLVIATLIVFAKEARQKGGDVRLCCPLEEAMNVIQITQLDKVFKIFKEEPEAVDSFK